MPSRNLKLPYKSGSSSTYTQIATFPVKDPEFGGLKTKSTHNLNMGVWQKTLPHRYGKVCATPRKKIYSTDDDPLQRAPLSGAARSVVNCGSAELAAGRAGIMREEPRAVSKRSGAAEEARQIKTMKVNSARGLHQNPVVEKKVDRGRPSIKFVCTPDE